jgi:hypothetical protein
MLTKNKFLISLMLIIPITHSQQGTGKQLAQDAMALVAHWEFSNIGAKDIDCKGTPFEVTDINLAIDKEIKPALIKLVSMENKNINQVEELILMIKMVPLTAKDGKTVVQTTYENFKKDNFNTYGRQAGCASLSASFRAVVQQRKLSIKNFMNN